MKWLAANNMEGIRFFLQDRIGNLSSQITVADRHALGSGPIVA
jgi:hypothetical protein